MSLLPSTPGIRGLYANTMNIIQLALLIMYIFANILACTSQLSKDCCWPDSFEASLGIAGGMPIDQTYEVNYVSD